MLFIPNCIRNHVIKLPLQTSQAAGTIGCCPSPARAGHVEMSRSNEAMAVFIRLKRKMGPCFYASVSSLMDLLLGKFLARKHLETKKNFRGFSVPFNRPPAMTCVVTHIGKSDLITITTVHLGTVSSRLGSSVGGFESCSGLNFYLFNLISQLLNLCI